MENTRSRLWNILLYPDDPTHVSALEVIKKSFNYVGILHDKDMKEKSDGLKKAHYHIIIKLSQARWVTGLSSELGIDTRWFEKTGSWDRSARYLLHHGRDNKYQYSPDELFGPLVPSVVKLLNDDDENVKVIKIIDLIDSINGEISFNFLVRLACKNGLYPELRRMGALGIRIVNEHNVLYNAFVKDNSEYKMWG